MSLKSPFVTVKCSSCGNEDIIFYASTAKPVKRCIICDEPLYSSTGGHANTLKHKIITSQSTDE